MSAAHEGGAAPAGLVRRLLSLAYELPLVCAVLALGALPFVVLTREIDPVAARPLFQLYLVLLAGVYFVPQWCRGGQTLPMKTWRLRLVRRNGGAPTPGQAARRYCLALAGTLALGAGFVWALIDRDGQFLHDRLAGTRIVKDEGGRMKEKNR
jgi:uncharacterized RDD family membrane protein YckC